MIAAFALAGNILSAQEREEIKPRQPKNPKPPLESPRGQPAPIPAPGIDPSLPPGSSVGQGFSYSPGAGSPWQSVNTAMTRVREMFNPPPTSLVVSAPAKSAEALANMEEDLEVMSRILDKAAGRVGQPQDPRYMGISIPGLSAGRTPQNFYIDGYGALFILNVRFPLSAGETKSNDEPQRPTNSTWEQARREVRGGGPVAPNTRVVEYSEEKVEALKKELIGDLKNATNIRGLKSDEAITVVVTGELEKEFGTETVHTRTAPSGATTSSRLESSDRRVRKTTMTMRVNKSDADAFAKGKMDAEDFQKKVAIAIY